MDRAVESAFYGYGEAAILAGLALGRVKTAIKNSSGVYVPGWVRWVMNNTEHYGPDWPAQLGRYLQALDAAACEAEWRLTGKVTLP